MKNGKINVRSKFYEFNLKSQIILIFLLVFKLIKPHKNIYKIYIYLLNKFAIFFCPHIIIGNLAPSYVFDYLYDKVIKYIFTNVLYIRLMISNVIYLFS